MKSYESSKYFVWTEIIITMSETETAEKKLTKSMDEIIFKKIVLLSVQTNFWWFYTFFMEVKRVYLVLPYYLKCQRFRISKKFHKSYWSYVKF